MTPPSEREAIVADVVPSYTLLLAVTLGVTVALLTVSVAAFEVAVGGVQEFVNTARY